MLAHRELTPRGESRGDVLLMHGFPESSYMWRDLMPALVGDGWRAVAPDLPGFGDSPPDPPGTWERKIEAVERFRAEAGLEQFVLVVHDWGGLIGLRWVCEQAGHRVRALVISGTGFFPDGKWHGMAEGLRASGTGEELVGSITREGFAAVMRQISPEHGETALDEYWACFGDEPHQQSVLELY